MQPAELKKVRCTFRFEVDFKQEINWVKKLNSSEHQSGCNSAVTGFTLDAAQTTLSISMRISGVASSSSAWLLDSILIDGDPLLKRVSENAFPMKPEDQISKYRFNSAPKK